MMACMAVSAVINGSTNWRDCRLIFSGLIIFSGIQNIISFTTRIPISKVWMMISKQDPYSVFAKHKNIIRYTASSIGISGQLIVYFTYGGCSLLIIKNISREGSIPLLSIGYLSSSIFHS